MTLHQAILDRDVHTALYQWLNDNIEKYPELAALKGVEQGRELHRLDVLDHLVATAVRGAELSKEAVIRIACLFHDLGKPPTFTVDMETSRITFPDHAEVGAGMMPALMEQLVTAGELPKSYLEKDGECVAAAAKCHMRVQWIADRNLKTNRQGEPEVTDKAVNRLVRFCDRHLYPTLLVCKADRLAQYEQDPEVVQKLQNRINGFGMKLQVPKPASAFLQGDEIAELLGGPGPEVGKAKAALIEAETKGAIKDRPSAEAFVRTKAYTGLIAVCSH